MNKQQIKQILEEEADLDKAVEQILDLCKTKLPTSDGSEPKLAKSTANKLEYEILSVKYSERIYKLSSDKSTFICGGGRISQDTFNSGEIGGFKITIHSVKRLSDGEVFTIGDYARYLPTHGGQEIKSFDISTYNGIIVHLTANLYFLTSISKAEIKKPLFKTEDGINVFNGDTYYFLHTSNNPGLKNDNPWDIDSQILGGAGCNLKLDNIYVKRFSTKEAALDYVILNKPCLSLKDLKNAGYVAASHNLTLKQLVKSKLN